MRKNKKGVSQVAIILIFVLIAVAIILYTEKIEKNKNGIVSSSDIDLDINEASLNGEELLLSLENKKNGKINDVKIKIIGSKATGNLESFGQLKGFGMSTREVNYSYEYIGKIKRIEAYPVIGKQIIETQMESISNIEINKDYLYFEDFEQGIGAFTKYQAGRTSGILDTTDEYSAVNDKSLKFTVDQHDIAPSNTIAYSTLIMLESGETYKISNFIKLDLDSGRLYVQYQCYGDSIEYGNLKSYTFSTEDFSYEEYEFDSSICNQFKIMYKFWHPSVPCNAVLLIDALRIDEII